MSMFELARELDDVIDLSRGRLQLEIVCRLGRVDGPVHVDELVRGLGERRKAVFDSLRKLESKSLISRNGESFLLTDFGKDVFSKIMLLKKSELESPISRGTFSLTKYDVARIMVGDLYLYETLQALNSSVKGVLAVDVLSKIVGVSSNVLDEHLLKFTKGELMFLNRHVKPRQIFGLKSTKIYYSLTEEGRKLVNLYLGSLSIRRKWSYKLLSKLVGTTHPRIILKRLALFLSIGSAFAMLLQFIIPTYSILVLSAWIWLISFFALLIENTY
ncbi:MAG: hypothetical protein N3F64_03720 [Nitrososphaeria archaeon]|nr:hypothetical protein [Nitrososphaeria archaeon]